MRYFILFLFVLLARPSHAQTWEEWTQQKKTQKKYLLQQIAAFQTYLGYARKGYDIAQQGLHTISQIKNGEWRLHRDFFTSLKVVNPAVLEIARLAYFISQQAELLKQSKQLITLCKQKGFSTSELQYFQRVTNGLIENGMTQLEQLHLLSTQGAVQMSDDERLKQIQTLQEGWQDLWGYFQSLKASVHGVIHNRQKERVEIEISKLLNGIR